MEQCKNEVCARSHPPILCPLGVSWPIAERTKKRSPRRRSRGLDEVVYSFTLSDHFLAAAGENLYTDRFDIAFFLTCSYGPFLSLRTCSEPPQKP